jgi:predicted ferric reductase
VTATFPAQRGQSAPAALRDQPAELTPPTSLIRPAARAHPNVVLAVILAGAAVTVGMWWQDTTTLSGLGDTLTSAGRVTGLLAGYAAVVLVALMARIPPVERGIGADRLARWHARGGRYTVGLIVTHALLIIWGYAVTAHANVVSQTGTLLASYPDVLMATIGGLLFVAVGITSARAARRRLRYETWHYLHLYTYLAVALAFSHQFATGADFMTHPLHRVWWATTYTAVAAAILWYRFITPIRQARRHQLRVEAVCPEAPGVVSVVIGGRHLDRLGAEPGQFFRWRFLTKGLWWVSAPYSLSAPPRPDRLRITVKALGDHSRLIRLLPPGTRVVAEGPFGALTAAVRRRPKVLLVAGGVRITPLRALFETVPAAPGDLTLVYRTSRPEDVVFRRELDDLAAQRGARLHYLTGRRREFAVDPLSAEALQANIPDLRDHDVYLCGPDGMTASVAAALRAAGIRRRQIHSESFSF